LKFKLDENLDVRLALSRLNEESMEGRLWIVEPGRVRVYVPENDQEE
jgi:hypothetical protein